MNRVWFFRLEKVSAEFLDIINIFTTMKINDIKSLNRKNLSKIKSFLSDTDYKASADNYGLPNSVRHLIDSPIGDSPTYTDLLLFLSQKLNVSKISYLEIGVSVLKNFYQIASFLEKSELYAFDINKPNPPISSLFHCISITEDENKYRYTYNHNDILYYQGDVFKSSDLESLQSLMQTPPNIIFSDAHHSGIGLFSEYIHLISKCLPSDFILYYDDLDNPASGMIDAFHAIFKDLKSSRPNVQGSLLQINGWLGENEHQHLNGIITSLDLRDILFSLNLPIPFRLL